MIVSTCLSCLMGLWGLVLGVISPAIIVRFAETGQFGASLRFAGWLDVIKANVGGYLIVMILMWVASGIIAPLGIILCVVGVIFTQFWAYLVWGNLLGQLGERGAPGQPDGGLRQTGVTGTSEGPVTPSAAAPVSKRW